MPVACSKLNKGPCTTEPSCQWVTGKGCKKVPAVRKSASVSPQPKAAKYASPHPKAQTKPKAKIVASKKSPAKKSIFSKDLLMEVVSKEIDNRMTIAPDLIDFIDKSLFEFAKHFITYKKIIDDEGNDITIPQALKALDNKVGKIMKDLGNKRHWNGSTDLELIRRAATEAFIRKKSDLYTNDLRSKLEKTFKKNDIKKDIEYYIAGGAEYLMFMVLYEANNEAIRTKVTVITKKHFLDGIEHYSEEIQAIFIALKVIKLADVLKKNANLH